MWGVGPGFADLGFRVSVSGLQALSHGVGWVSSYVLSRLVDRRSSFT